MDETCPLLYGRGGDRRRLLRRRAALLEDLRAQRTAVSPTPRRAEIIRSAPLPQDSRGNGERGDLVPQLDDGRGVLGVLQLRTDQHHLQLLHAAPRPAPSVSMRPPPPNVCVLTPRPPHADAMLPHTPMLCYPTRRCYATPPCSSLARQSALTPTGGRDGARGEGAEGQRPAAPLAPPEGPPPWRGSPLHPTRSTTQRTARRSAPAAPRAGGRHCRAGIDSFAKP